MKEFWYPLAPEKKRTWWCVMRAPVGSHPSIVGAIEVDFLSAAAAQSLARRFNILGEAR
jgi:hypothetical protein